MAPFVITLAYFLVIIGISLRPNWKQPSKKTFWVSAGFLTSAFVMLALASFNIYTPSPLIPVEKIVNLFFHIE